MHYLILALCLLLSACGGSTSSQVSAKQQVSAMTSPYFPMVAGNTITYDIYFITGTLNPTTFEIGNVQITGYDAVETAIYTQQTCSNYGSEQFIVWNWYGGIDPPASFTSPYYFMADGNFVSNGGVAYIGEGFNAGGVVSPGEPILTLSPIIGEEIDTVSTVASSCGSTTPLYTYATSYRTLSNVDSYGVGDDVWVTGLIEWNSGMFDGGDDAPTAYNYTYQRDFGMIRDIVLQKINADYSASGLMYVARE